jgi:hypothetical protein
MVQAIDGLPLTGVGDGCPLDDAAGVEGDGTDAIAAGVEGGTVDWHAATTVAASTRVRHDRRTITQLTAKRRAGFR